jgi:glycosyltransferase involved in cell wall biosynthesis
MHPMPASAAAVNRESHPPIAAAHVAILMGTKNGAKFIAEQLASIADQTHADWSLFVSDDGSTDNTREIITRFARDRRQKILVRSGPEQGVSANFISLATDATIDADYFAFSDQDDIWYSDKLARALIWFATVPEKIPGMYCGRTELADTDGKTYGYSLLFSRPPAFQNALVQSLAGGNTMVFNRAAKKLLEQMGKVDVVLHDWWLYQLVSATGGAVRYDPQPMLKYRQHGNSLIGSNLGWRARMVRIRMTLSGRFHDWNVINIAALERVPAQLMKPENRNVLTLFTKATKAKLFKRLMYYRQSGVYRQTMLGNIAMFVSLIINKL